MDKILHHTIRLRCETGKAFEMFTINKHLEAWLTAKAEVDPVIGGKFELFWNPEDRENDSTIGCNVTAVEPGKLFAFEWKGPSQFKHFMNNADPLTHVTVAIIPCTDSGKDETEVHVIHTGWRSSPEWEEARLWFQKAWDGALGELKKYVEAE